MSRVDDLHNSESFLQFFKVDDIQMIRWNDITYLQISKSEEFHCGDSLNLMPDVIDSTLDQIEINIAKTGTSFGGWIVL